MKILICSSSASRELYLQSNTDAELSDRIWLGVAEYLFRKPQLLDEVIATAIEDDTFRSDDLEFTFAARGWSECVSFGNFAAYKDRFEKIQGYFAGQFEEANRVGNEMLKVIGKHLEDREDPSG